MALADTLGYAAGAIAANRLRTALILAAMAIGVAAVIVLTALGDGARRFVTGEFATLGTNLLIVLPGRTETTGGPPPMFGETPRDLTVDDAFALLASAHVVRMAPVAVGSAPVSFANREREVDVLGTTAGMLEVRRLRMGQGRFLPHSEPRRASPVCVLGHGLKKELFDERSALGHWLRIGAHRCRVIGVLEQTGVSIGVDFSDLVIVPVASAQMIFDQSSLFRILAEARTAAGAEAARDDIRRIIRARHEGEDDVTIITQDSVIATFDRIFAALTFGVAGIAAISLAVAGILIMNIMLVAVTQRTPEVGLLKALGAPARTIRRLFVAEALLLSLFGAAIGMGLGLALAALLARLYPLLPVAAPHWAVAAAPGIAITAGLVFGVLPAARAARLDPVSALSRR